jgi:hypothetical protein
VITKPDGSVWARNSFDSNGVIASAYLYGKTTEFTYICPYQKLRQD